MSISKKQRERVSLDCVLNFLAISPIIIDETEEPDFLFDLNDTRIGVEVTELYIPPNSNSEFPKQAQENEERVMVEMACRLAIDNHIPPQQLQLRISTLVLRKELRMEVANQIYDFVAKNFARPGEVKSFGRAELPKNIIHLTVYGLKNPPHKWKGSCSGWVNSKFISGFQKSIDKKEVLREKYLKRCSEIWLITVATHEGGSSFIELSKGDETHQFKAGFDKVFFVDSSRSKVKELSIETV